jgi:drug/metabolite transporter (DMT)-like permease
MIYPLSEALMASIFILISYAYFYMGELFSPSHICLLILGFITGVYTLYDIRYMEIPDQIIVPGILGYLLILIGALIWSDMSIFLFDRNTYLSDIGSYFLDHVVAAWILYSFFYLQILLPG